MGIVMRLRLCLLVLLVPPLLVMCARLTCAQVSDRSLAESARSVRRIIAHRGSSADRPENTRAAYERAIQAGATAIETDVTVSRDGRLVVMHDGTVDRTTNGSGPVGGLTLAELKRLDAGSWFHPRFKKERVLTLREVLELCKGRVGVVVDSKEDGTGMVAKMIDEIQRYGDPKETLLVLGSAARIRFYREHLPEATRMGFIQDPAQIEEFLAAGANLIRLYPRWAKDKTVVERVRRAGAELHMIARLGSKQELLELLPYRPDSIHTDDPGRLIGSLAEFSEKQR